MPFDLYPHGTASETEESREALSRKADSSNSPSLLIGTGEKDRVGVLQRKNLHRRDHWASDT